MVEQLLSKTGTWLLIALFLLVFLLAFYSRDKGFMSQASNLVLQFGEWFLPAEPQKELKQSEDIPKKVGETQEFFKAAVENALKTSSESKLCLVTLPSFSSLENFGMEVSNDNNNLNSKIIKKSGPGYVFLNKLAMQNAKVCLLNTQNFYKCYLSKEQNLSIIHI